MAIEINPDEDFHVVLNGVVTALSLNALDAAYDGDVIREDTLIWQQGFEEWMRLDALLAALDSQDQQEQAAIHAAHAAAPVEDDLYFVLVAPEEVKKMSLDLLADAYRLEVIDEGTLVWQPGYNEWVPLSVLIGTDEPLPHYSLAPSLAPSAPPAPSSRAAGVAPPAPSSAYPSQAPGAPVSAYPSAVSSSPVSAYPSAVPSSPVSAYPSAVPSSPVSAYPSAVPADIPLPPEAPRASPWFRRSLVALSTFAFVFVLHRNGLSYEIAASLDKTEELVGFEEKFGPSKHQTPHGLQRWLAGLEETYQLTELSDTEPLPGEKRADATDDEDSSDEDSDSAATKAEGGTDKSLAEEGAKAGDAAHNKGEKASKFGGLLSGKKPQPKSAPAKPRVSRPKQSKPKSSGLAYDPMNGAL